MYMHARDAEPGVDQPLKCMVIALTGLLRKHVAAED